MKSVIHISFMVEGIQQKIPFNIVSKNEPNKEQILEKVYDIVEHYGLESEVKFENFYQDKDQKLYTYKIGDKNCAVLIQRLDLMEFPK